MEESLFQQPDLVGRQNELGKIREAFSMAAQKNGNTMLIAGEAGIGKTRLVSELLKDNCDEFKLIQGWCLAENLESLMPIKQALRDAGMQHLVSGEPPPRVISSFLMNDAGMLIAKSERDESNLDPDIFTGMLKAVSDFVRESLSMMGKGTGSGLNSLGYERYKILIQMHGKLSLIAMIEGQESEFLMEDMKRTLVDIGDRFDNWSGRLSEVGDVKAKMGWFVNSGKYDGKFFVDDPKIKQENMFDSVLLGIEREAEVRPIVLFLDDLQWADPTTLNLLHYLSRNTRKSRVLILGTYRPEDLIRPNGERTHPLELAMQNMSREGLFEKVELSRLNADDTETIIRKALKSVDFERGFIERVFKETEGSPFFILEVLKLLDGNKSIVRGNEGKWTLAGNLDTLDIPSKVYDVIRRRLDRLENEQRELLECASTVGEEFRSDVLERVTGYNRIHVLRHMSDIEKIHRLIRFLSDRYRFDHAKIRNVLYLGIGEELRREYHRLVGDAISQLNADCLDEVVTELAYHYHQAKDKRATDFLVAAGNKARERYANEEAIRMFSTALTSANASLRLETLEKLADTQMLINDYDKALDCFGQTVESMADDVPARILRKMGEIHEKKGDFSKSLEYLAKARERSDDSDKFEHGRILIAEGSAHWRMGDYGNAMKRFMEAIETFEMADGADEDIGNALRMVGNIHISRGEKEQALEFSGKSLAMMEKIGNQYGTASALNNIGIVHRNAGDLDLALEYYEKSLEIRNKIREKRGIAFSMINIGNLYWDKGELDKALEHYQRSLEILEKIQDKHGLGLSLNNIGLVHMTRGELGRALDYFSRCLDIKTSIGDKEGKTMVLGDIGLAELENGNIPAAIEKLGESLALCLEMKDIRREVHARCGLSDANLMAGNEQEAREHAEKALELSMELGAAREEGMSLHALGNVHRHSNALDEAAKEFEKAKTILEKVGEKTELAYLLYDRALLFTAMGNPARARESSECALAMFHKMGMALWEAKCRAIMMGR
ncbi:MAG: tetratricopeptide repeat protein [Thermoplasmata archaeon]